MEFSEVEVIAANAYSVLEVDATATPWLHSMYPDLSTILEAFSYFDIQIAPSLCGLLRSPQAPSLNEMLSCTLPEDNSSDWVVYLQHFQKDSEIYHHIFCGSGTRADGGDKRLADYDAYLDKGKDPSTISPDIVKLVSQGYERVGVTILFRAEVPGDVYDFHYLRALFLLLEGAITAKFWLFKSSTFGRLSGSCLWDKDNLPYLGLCGHSSLSEVVPPRVLDILECPDMRRDWAQARKEKKQKTTKKYQQSAKGKETYRTYQQSEYGKAVIKRNLQSEKGKARVKRSNKSEARKKAKKKWSESEKGEANKAKRREVWNQKYGQNGTEPDLVCEGCPTPGGFKTKDPWSLKRHQKKCPVHRKA